MLVITRGSRDAAITVTVTGALVVELSTGTRAAFPAAVEREQAERLAL
jgi:hypothetical protein